MNTNTKTNKLLHLKGNLHIKVCLQVLGRTTAHVNNKVVQSL